jgi:hypothetical protein
MEQIILLQFLILLVAVQGVVEEVEQELLPAVEFLLQPT